MQAREVRKILRRNLGPTMHQLGFTHASTPANWRKPFDGGHYGRYLMVYVYVGRFGGWFAIEIGPSTSQFLTDTHHIVRHSDFLTLEQKEVLGVVENDVRRRHGYPPLRVDQAGHHDYDTAEDVEQYGQLLSRFLPDVLERFEKKWATGWRPRF